MADRPSRFASSPGFPSLDRRLLPAALLAAILLFFYRGGLGRDFTSEDFLILRRLGSGEFWARAAEGFTGPWLGATFVPFFRPFSSLLLQTELWLFGPRPLPFLLLQLAVHGATSLLLAAFLGRLLPAAKKTEIFLAVLLFALYPLHPNTVLFVASFATLFATFFLFAALLLEATGRRPAALAAGALALLSYEQAVVFPALILLFDLAAKPGGLSRRWRLWPYFALAAIYLALRGAILGDLGGYAGFRARLFDPAALGASLAEVAGRLFVPHFGIAATPLLSLGVVAVLALAAGFAVARRAEPGPRLLLAALAAIPVVQAPFIFTGVVPGNGRYFYLASALVAIVAWQALRLLPRAEKLTAPLLAGLALLAGAALAPVVAVYAEAADRCSAIRASLEALPPGRVFVAGRPLFLERWGVPVAQVFHWGLADAILPPFSPRRDLAVYPLPELSDAELAPLLLQPELGRAVRLAEGDRATLLTAAEGAAGAAPLEARLEAGTIRFAAPPEANRLRLVVLTQGGPSVLDLEANVGELTARVPAATLDGMGRLYPGAPIFAWVAADLPNGGRAATPVFELEAPRLSSRP